MLQYTRLFRCLTGTTKLGLVSNAPKNVDEADDDAFTLHLADVDHVEYRRSMSDIVANMDGWIRGSAMH